MIELLYVSVFLDFSHRQPYALYKGGDFVIYDCVQNDRVDYRCLDQIGHQTEDLYLRYCGIEFCPPDHTYSKILSEYLIHFIFKGKGFYVINGHTYEIHAEQAFLIPPGVDNYYYADSSDPYAYVWVAFDGSKASDYLAQTPLSIGHPVCDLHIPAAQFRALAEQIMEAGELTISNEIKRVSYLYHIFAKLIASGQSQKSGPAPLNYSSETYADYALQYIELNYDHITISDIVNHVGIDRSYLYKVFKKQFHVSPQEYLISYRMEEAVKLLTSTDRSIISIAGAVGYTDALTFSRIFKKQTGESPKHYRLSHRKPQEGSQ